MPFVATLFLVVGRSESFHLPVIAAKSTSSSTRNQVPIAPPLFQSLRTRSLGSAESLVALSEAKAVDHTSKVPSRMTEAIHLFFFGDEKGPICVVGMLAAMSIGRVQLGGLSEVDAIAFLVPVVFWWIQEHVLHEKLLHSDMDWMGKEIHCEHHQKPYFHISIDPAPLMVGWLTAAHLFLRFLVPTPLALSATLGYATAGLVYEWAHFIVHTRVKPPNSFWKRVRDNHIKHHLVDDRYWLSFTVPAVDDLFGTNPSVDDVKREQALAIKKLKLTRKLQPVSH
jgi:hypothetical protein